jgi:hypothetical protein
MAMRILYIFHLFIYIHMFLKWQIDLQEIYNVFKT